MNAAAAFLDSRAIKTVAETAEVAGGAGEAWAFPALPTTEVPEEPEGLCTVLTVELEFEIEKKEELDN